MNKVLVTGADGFIGSHLAEYLAGRGYSVRAMVHYNAFNGWGWLDQSAPAASGAIEVVAGDVRDPRSVKEAMRGCDTVLHLAALIAIPYSYLAPASYIDTNVVGTLNVLEAARDDGVRVVHTSTSEVYGSALRVPIDEDHPLQAQSPYAASKIGADQLALSYHRSFGLPVAVIRPFNTYGPRQSARAFIPTVIGQIAAGARAVKLGALTPTRDLNFVMDTVRGFEAVALCDAALGQVLNIGSDFEISVGDTARLIAEVMGAEIELVCDEARLRPAASEVERLRADNRRARTLTGWAPDYAGQDGLRRGLALTADWFRDPANLARYKVDRYNL